MASWCFLAPQRATSEALTACGAAPFDGGSGDRLRPPTAVWMREKIGIEVSGIMSDLFSQPLGPLERLAFRPQFDLCDYKTCVLASELVYLPGAGAVRNDPTNLFDERTLAQFEEGMAIREENLILELRSRVAFCSTLDGEECLLTSDPNSHGSIFVSIQIALTEEQTCTLPPSAAYNQELAFDLDAHLFPRLPDVERSGGHRHAHAGGRPLDGRGGRHLGGAGTRP